MVFFIGTLQRGRVEQKHAKTLGATRFLPPWNGWVGRGRASLSLTGAAPDRHRQLTFAMSPLNLDVVTV
jgi:hypothetical protein